VELYQDYDQQVHKAIMHRDHHPLLGLLNNEGLNPNYRLGRRQKTLLHLAAVKGDPEMVTILLSHGANVNALDNNGDSALYLALNLPLFFHQIAIVQSLLDAGAKVNHQNHDGWSPLHRACFLGEPKLVEIILRHKSQVYSLTYTQPNIVPLQLVKVTEHGILFAI
jgi:ankyrin repeat protein